MNKKILVVLLITVAVVIAAIATQSKQTSATSTAVTGELIAPNLAAQAANVAKVELEKAGEFEKVVLEKQGDNWGLQSRSGYPINTAILQKILSAAAQAKVSELMTSKPEYYQRLGLQGLDKEGSQATALRVFSADGQLIESLLFGETVKRGSGLSTYIRGENDTQAKLVEGVLDLNFDAQKWLQRDIVNIPRPDIQSVVTTHADGEVVTVSREAKEQPFVLAQLPEGRELMYASVTNTPASALQTLKLEDVFAQASKPLAADKTVTTAYKLFSAVEITVKSVREGPEYFAEFTASYNGDDADITEKVTQWNKRWQGWVYRIPVHKYNQLAKRIDDMLKVRESVSEPE